MKKRKDFCGAWGSVLAKVFFIEIAVDLFGLVFLPNDTVKSRDGQMGELRF